MKSPVDRYKEKKSRVSKCSLPLSFKILLVFHLCTLSACLCILRAGAWMLGGLLHPVGINKGNNMEIDSAAFFLSGLILDILFFKVALVVKNPPASARDIRDTDLIPEWGRFPGGGHGNLLLFLPGESHGQGSLTGYSS